MKCARSVDKLSGGLVMLLGAKFEIDYDTLTSPLYSSDREYFASPLSERGDQKGRSSPGADPSGLTHSSGPQRVSHFYLVLFRAVENTSDDFLVSRRIDRTVRLMKFLGLRDEPDHERPRVYVIRRVSSHFRLKGKL